MAAAARTLDTLLKILLILYATPGIIALAERATNPAIRAYSIRSCARLSLQILSADIHGITGLPILYVPIISPIC